MEVVVRATVVFWLLWTLLRASGKRELAELTPFELIVLMVMGDLIQQGVTEEDMSVTGAGLAVCTMLLWALALSYVTFRSRRARSVFQSSPVVMIRDGTIDRDMLRVQRITLDDLLDELRLAGVSHVSDVDLGVLESDGKMSFLKRHGDDTTPRRDSSPAT
jgi:uncharacterized membrane protein YcaP (DUF421 family)